MSNTFVSTSLAAMACVAWAVPAAAANPPSQAFIPAPSIAQGRTAAAQPADGPAEPPASVQWVDQQVAQYRTQVEARVARGDMSPDEAERLIGWHRWQLQQQAAGQAPAPAIIARQNADDDARRRVAANAPYPPAYYGAYPAPYYPPAYTPYYYDPRYRGPLVPGISVCTGGFGRHYSAAFCF
ncbi:MAG: hypothetical protein ABI552_08265 [Casimicrobiaceae bacterium]